jgi:hypothetical protein
MIKRVGIICLFFANLAFSTICKADELDLSDDKRGIRVVKHSGDRFGTDTLVFALWDDGNLIWSTDEIRGENSFFKGHVEETVSEKCIRELLLTLADTTVRDYRVVDSEFISIFVSDGNKKIELRSCHELIEQNPELVATSLGIRLLNAESRSKALSLEPIEFILFRLSWSDVRRKLQSLAMGSKRISIEGQIERRDGKLFFSF